MGLGDGFDMKSNEEEEENQTNIPNFKFLYLVEELRYHRQQ